MLGFFHATKNLGITLDISLTICMLDTDRSNWNVGKWEGCHYFVIKIKAREIVFK